MRRNFAPAVLQGQVYRLKIWGSLFGQTTINRFDIVQDTPRANDSPDVVINSFWAQFGPSWLAAISKDWHMTDITCECLTQADQVVFDQEYTTVVGLHPDIADTSWVQAGIKKETKLRGQHGRGAVRVPGVPASQILGNTWTAAYKTLLANISGALLNRIPGANTPAAGYLYVVTTRFNQPAPPNPPVVNPLIQGTVITKSDVALYASTQRSRKPRVVE